MSFSLSKAVFIAISVGLHLLLLMAFFLFSKQLLPAEDKLKSNRVIELKLVKPKVEVKNKSKTVNRKSKLNNKKSELARAEKNTKYAKTGVQSSKVTDFKMQFWLTRVESIWQNAWQKEKKNYKGKKKIFGSIFTKITRLGTIQNSRIYKSSGNKSMDEDALAVVIRMRKVPPIPSTYKKKTFNLEFVFSANE